MTGPGAESAAAEPAPAEQPRAPIPCPRCGALLEGDQSWCLECGLSVRTRLAPTANWRAPLVVAGAVGLAAIAALIVAFLVVTGDNAPLPTTAAPAPAATTAPPTTTVATVPTTPGTTPTVPAIPQTTAEPATTTAEPPATAPESGGTPAP